MINYYKNMIKELHELHDRMDDEKDKELLSVAIGFLITGQASLPEPKNYTFTEIPGYGYQYVRVD